MMTLLNYNRAELIRYVRDNFAKSETYGDALFRKLYHGSSRDKKFENLPAFKDFFTRAIKTELPLLAKTVEENGTVKFLLDMGQNHFSESVLIPMKKYSTLCLSSQIGCAYGCVFCATGHMGFVRNLSTAEIVSQLLVARYTLGSDDLQNVVFMGMGEPFDNFDNLITTLDILSDERGLNIPKRRISISTAGHIDGIRKLSNLCHSNPEKNYHTLHLSLSLHSAREETRQVLMPITKIYPLAELRTVLLDSPFSQTKDGLYIEYMIIPGVSDKEAELETLGLFLEGMNIKINLIPFNPVKGSPWKAPTNEEINKVWCSLKEAGYYCRTRLSKGETMMAACGQLGGGSEIK
ncbi:23S rRNA (adenine(2503)-C(2))-methyltransferase RlmN [Oceanispirochaeta crateris]|uniref:23S rRNA (Adenine(2503)-C(2))-methyltransferase RlmN n=1 Tax=Oceanispirochaeta crateris TaxID=2518645 RepID=A0A5C1QMK5_9SPIO|nr:23S rRNA (adenine(2503)-C(2))-methyltransferase RlmN [Oceanispirochaeta crateris]QEN07796.1 23S rRNA (adenine(2503)-C(2))-methyltransferase RlmN [Oceanispirochaeta crateris]